jgi:hypothetical protein
VGGVWVDLAIEVRRTIVKYFKNQVEDIPWARPTLDGVQFTSISIDDNKSLVAPFSLVEIETMVKNSDGHKILGSDGFNFPFSRSFGTLYMKHKIRIMFDQFHANKIIPKGFLSFFVMLIPKVNAHLLLKDYRPISLWGSLYTSLSKVWHHDYPIL